MEAAASSSSRPLYTLPPPVSEPHPWLVITHGKRLQRKTFVSISTNRYQTKIIPEMRNMYIFYSYREWLVLSCMSSEDFFLLNLESMEKIQLPPIEILDYSMCFLTALPSDSQCRIVFMDLRTKVLAFCRLCDREYSKYSFEEGFSSLEYMTIFDGKVIGFTYPQCSLLTIRFEDSNNLQFTPITVEQVPEILRCHKYDYRNYLIDFFGELVLVHKFRYNKSPWDLDFKIFKMNFSTMAWVEMKDLGENIIFLDDRHGKCCRALIGSEIRRNSIYFVELDDTKLYAFDLEVRSIATYLPCPLARSCYLIWVMLPFSQETSNR